jgi:UDP-N-acetylmuramoylalanine--D-glutamate ligase
MLIPYDMKGQIIGVLGLGSSGLAAIATLQAAGAYVFAFDDVKTQQDIPKITLTPWRDWPWDELEAMVISPGIPHKYPMPHPAAAHANRWQIPIISEVELALRAKPKAQLIAITGTNGKSTTTALIGHCLQTAGCPVAIGGNLGDAACSLDDPGENGTLVLELSSYQLETTPSLKPSISILLNISPDHLDRHGGMAGYIAAKALVLERLDKLGIAIIGAGDEHVQTLAKLTAARGIKTLIASPDLAPISQQGSTALTGMHNAENAAAAALALHAIGLDDQVINLGISSFTNLPHRLQRVASCGKVQFINDSKATNGIAAAKALKAFNDIYWVAGGLAKQDGLLPTMPHLGAVKKAYLIGTAAPAFATSLSGICPVAICDDLEQATRAAFNDATADPDGGTILLAPAAASFDQFPNFGARGDMFAALAHDLCNAEYANHNATTRRRDSHA